MIFSSCGPTLEGAQAALLANSVWTPVTDEPIKKVNPTEFCRRRADECDRRSKLATEPEIKSEWAALIEWHLLDRFAKPAQG
jgi:hypothetical protein